MFLNQKKGKNDMVNYVALYEGNTGFETIVGMVAGLIGIILNIYPKMNYATKKYSNYGIENRKHFVENYNKIQNQIKYRMDIQNKNEYINKVLNKFYGNVDVSIPDEEILKKLKR